MRSLKAVAKQYLPQPAASLLRRVRSRLSRPSQLNQHAWHEYTNRREFLRRALTTLKFNGIAGDYAEFGCCGAMSFCIVYRLLAEYSYAVGPFHLWAFDSFQGLPETTLREDSHPHWEEGAMATSLDEFHHLCRSRGVPPSAYTTVPGFYEQSLDASAPGPRPEKIRLAYIDCDLYSSTRAVLQFLMPRLQHGMILAFDDYYCYSSTLPSGERLAAAEAFAGNASWRLVPYVQIGWHGMSFIVEGTGNGIPSGFHGSHW